ncbi:MAG: peptidylprolyl isomerase [Mariprofundaceae bacterium]
MTTGDITHLFFVNRFDTNTASMLAAMQFKTTTLASLLTCQARACQNNLVKVGSTFIYQSDLDTALQNLPEHLQHLGRDPTAQQHILNTLIRRAVLSQQASSLGLQHDSAIRKRIKQNQGSILIEALRHWKITQLSAPEPQDIQQYYQKNISNFTIPEKIHARHILVAHQQQAADLVKQLQHKKSNFTTLAAHFSLDDRNRSRSGDLNWFARGMMLKSFEEVAFNLKNIGDISQPVHTPYGWHIIELLGLRPAYQQSMSEVHDEIL